MRETSLYLPEEIWRQIFEKLDEQHIARVSLVSRQFLSITSTLKLRLNISDQIVPIITGVLRRFQYLENTIICTKSLDCLVGLLFQISSSRLSHEARKRLKKMDFRSLTSSLSDKLLLTISDCFPELEEINFHNVGFDKTTKDQWIAPNLKKLKKIVFGGPSYFLSDETIVSLSLNSKDLEEIVILCRGHKVTENGIGFLMRNSPKLTSLTLSSLKESYKNIHFSIENSTAYAKDLHTLCFRHMKISNKLVSSIATANPPIKKVTMSQIEDIETQALSMFFRAFRSIEDLEMTKIDIEILIDSSVEIISPYLAKLTRINLSCCVGLGNRSFFLLTNSCPLLEEFEMDWTVLGDGDISHINLRKNDKIGYLSICRNRSLDDKTLNIIARVCSNIQFLNISYCHLLTEESIGEILKSCPLLTHLDITKSKVSNFFGKFSKGGILDLKILRAQTSKLNDEAMGEIGRICSDLEFLDIGYCEEVTQIGVMEVVKNCKKLEKINLTRCENVSFDDLNIMVRTRPSLKKIIMGPDFVASEMQKNAFRENYGCKILARDDVSW